MTDQPLPTYGQALATCAFMALIAVVCAGLIGAAALVPAPPPALPFLVAVCIGCPMLAAWQASPSVALLRQRWTRSQLDERAVVELRRELDRLPETAHPLDH